MSRNEGWAEDAHPKMRPIRARKRRSVRGATVLALVGTAVVAALAVWSVGRLFERREVERAYDRLTSSLNAGRVHMASRSRAAENRAYALARQASVQRALRQRDPAPLRTLGAQEPVAFFAGTRLLAGNAVSPALVRSVDVKSGDGRTAGRVKAYVPLTAALLEQVRAAARPGPGVQFAFASGGRVVVGPSAGDRVPVPVRGRLNLTLDGRSFRAVSAPLASEQRVELIAAIERRLVDASAADARDRASLATAATIVTLLFLATIASQLRRGAAARRASTEAERVRVTLARLGEALAATHNPDALLPVILDTSVQATGAVGGRLLRGPDEIASTGLVSGGRERLELSLGPDEEGEDVKLHLYPREEGFDAESATLAAWFVSQAAIALENARLHRIVQRQALTDELTGLANRRRFLEQLDLEVSRAERFDGRLATVIADLDDFKSINDRYGHEFGNEVLQRVADVLNRSLRDVDVAARLGGEEFALLLPETDLGGGRALADRLRRDVEELRIVAPNGSPLHLTASFGVAAFPRASTAEALLRAADAAQYRAKDLGKNRVVAG